MATIVVMPITDTAQIKRLIEFASDVAELANQRPDLDLSNLIDDLHHDLIRFTNQEDRPMTRDELTDRIFELFPKLAEVEPWEWNETEDSEPVVMIETHATFTGMYDGAIDLTAPVPNTTKVGVWRIEPDGHYELKGLMDDPVVTAAAEQASRN